MNNLTENIITGDVKWKDDYMLSKNFTCGYCGAYVSSDRGMPLQELTEGYSPNFANCHSIGVYVCPNCYMPTFIYNDIQEPGNRYGSPVKGVPKNVNEVYEEARSCYAANAYTGTVLLCRKLLMHVAVNLGASDNLRFIEYVNYLNEKHFVSVKSHNWIDQIRKYGNEATHELEVNSQQDAQMILKFCEMLLKMNYEYPSIIEESNNN